MTKDEALKQALEWYDSGKEDRQEFETLIRRLLAEQPAQQEPVAWMGVPVMQGRYKEAVFCSDKDLAMQWDYGGHLGLGRLIVIPLYTSPPASKPWVGLTDEEVKHEWVVWRANSPRYMGFAIGIEAKLREKNNG